MTDGAASGYILTSDGSGNASWANPFALSSSLWSLDANGLDISNSNAGFVGIGTTTPASTLTVSGQGASPGGVSETSPNSVLEVDNNRVAVGLLTAPYANYSLKVNRNDNGTVITDMVVNSSGYVGIGTTSPVSPLDVYGDAAFRSGIAVSGNSYTNGNTYQFGTLYTQGTADFSSDVYVVGNTQTSNLQMTNGATAGYILKSDASGNASWVNPVTSGISLWTASGGNIYNNNSGNVGINTNSPQAALDVQGTVRIGNVTMPVVYPATNGYMLFVQGGVLAESFKVAPSSSADWFDMVFDSSYALRPLADVEQYVRKNRHPPRYTIC